MPGKCLRMYGAVVLLEISQNAVERRLASAHDDGTMSRRIRRIIVRTLRVALAVMRVAIVLGAVNLSGFVHATTDIVAVFADGHAHSEDDCNEHDCPPGCPSCHHAHSGALPMGESGIALAEVPSGSTDLVPFASNGPPPDRGLPTPERPPRT